MPTFHRRALNSFSFGPFYLYILNPFCLYTMLGHTDSVRPLRRSYFMLILHS